MQRLTDLRPAQWLLASSTTWPRLVTQGPAGFEAYARLRYIPDPEYPGLEESDVTLAADHPSDFQQAWRTLQLLGQITGSDANCFVCLWTGYGGTYTTPEMDVGPFLALPHRDYVLFAGRVDELQDGEADFGDGASCPPPAFVWSADHAWCFTSDVDPHWAGIGASRQAIELLCRERSLDIVSVLDPEQAPPRYGAV